MNEFKIIQFSDYIKYTSLKEFMQWDEFEITENPLPSFAIERIQDKAINLLSRNYGYYQVGVELVGNTGDYPTFYFPELEADLMIYFPELVQALSITLKMLGINVPEVDTITETYDRTEDITNNQTSDNINLVETDISNDSTTNQTSTNDTSQTTNGTSKNTGTSINDILYEREITNSSQVDETGNRNVNLSHQMPEQAINGTGNFPEDTQGTPILSTSYIQSANENFSTMNPMQTSETSNQKDIQNKQTTTNDLTQTNDNLLDSLTTVEGETIDSTTGKSTTNENLKNIVAGEGKNIIHEVKTIEKTNPQYAGEITKFLDNVQSFNAFQVFVDKFSWLSGIL